MKSVSSIRLSYRLKKARRRSKQLWDRTSTRERRRCRGQRRRCCCYPTLRLLPVTRSGVRQGIPSQTKYRCTTYAKRRCPCPAQRGRGAPSPMSRRPVRSRRQAARWETSKPPTHCLSTSAARRRRRYRGQKRRSNYSLMMSLLVTRL
jgi:hypothetical protein